MSGHFSLPYFGPFCGTGCLGGSALEAEMLSGGSWREAGGPLGLRASLAAVNSALNTGRGALGWGLRARSGRGLAAGWRALA